MSALIPAQFDDQSIRRAERGGKVYYSLVDIVATFSGTTLARRYWSDTKRRLKSDGFQLYENIIHLKLPSSDGKFYKTDVADAETCLRIVQSIPSPHAEPVRQWLARVGMDRLEETANPELGIQRAQNRAVDVYENRGMDSAWIAARLKGIDDRKAFTDALQKHVIGILGKHYGIATNEVYTGLWGRTATQLKDEIGIPQKANLRDFQPRLAIILQTTVEATVSEILQDRQFVYPQEAIHIIDQVTSIVQMQAEQLSRLTGKDIATGRPLLAKGTAS